MENVSGFTVQDRLDGLHMLYGDMQLELQQVQRALDVAECAVAEEQQKREAIAASHSAVVLENMRLTGRVQKYFAINMLMEEELQFYRNASAVVVPFLDLNAKIGYSQRQIRNLIACMRYR